MDDSNQLEKSNLHNLNNPNHKNNYNKLDNINHVDNQNNNQKDLIFRLHQALPQTQCTRCGFPDCETYARAIALENVAINQCPPSGSEGIKRLAEITQRDVLPLNPEFGQESPRLVAFIDENWCIGCTLCLAVCPTDAIVGSNKFMHSIIEKYCTGCELCVPVCPVDCIKLENASGDQTGWNAWSDEQAQTALKRYQAHQARQIRMEAENQARLNAIAQVKLDDIISHSRIENPSELERKRQLIEATLERAKAKREAAENKNQIK